MHVAALVVLIVEGVGGGDEICRGRLQLLRNELCVYILLFELRVQYLTC